MDFLNLIYRELPLGDSK